MSLVSSSSGPIESSTSSTNSAIIESITCPITGGVMTQPVSTPSGHTYENSAIVEWLARNPTSPQTRQRINASQLQNNTSILYLCDKYHRGEFGPKQVHKSPPKISADNIELSHTQLSGRDNHIMLSFDINKQTFPKELSHLSQDVVLVIDHSGSMGVSVEAKDVDGNKLENGFSIQDIVNHAAKTIASILDSNSRLAVIIFDNSIDVIYELKLMTDINKTSAISKINDIKPAGQTNIYGALEKAIQILDERDDKTRNGAILMLTDGVPNIEPARGTAPTLIKLRQKKNFTAPIYTFGFGYNLQRQLLYEIAKSSNGANGHIPDGGMIATVFCNFIATILSTVVVNLQLHVTSEVTLLGDYAYTFNEDNHTTIYDIGTVQYQQSRDIILKCNSPDIKYFFTYKIGGTSHKSPEYSYAITSVKENTPAFNDNLYRFYLIDNIRTMINYCRVSDYKTASDLLDTFDLKLKNIPTSPLIAGMIKNLSGDFTSDGQIKMAISSQYFTRWGEFYLDQLSRSLNQQIKPNFKDDACLFGGDVFNLIVDQASDTFDSLPPPQPSVQAQPSRFGARSVQTPRTTVNMSMYNNIGGGCFTGDAKILLADKTLKMVKDLKKGEQVVSLIDPYNLNKGFTSARVVCVLKTITSGSTNLVTTQRGLKITPWHPIVSHGVWRYPHTIHETIMEECNEVYTILLDKYHTFNLNGSWVIGIGHNYMVGILAHDYFGTNKIVKDIMNDKDWLTGLVTINFKQFVRDPITEEIYSIKIEEREVVDYFKTNQLVTVQ